MRRVPADRLVAAGGAIAGIGAAGAIAYYVYVVSGTHRDYWRVPGIVSLVVLCVGALMLVRGIVREDAPRTRQLGDQHQRGGDRSINLQAGRDIRQDGDDSS